MTDGRTGRQRLVVIGNGMAAGRAMEDLFAHAPGRYDVTVFGAEPRVNYNRIMLSPVLSGEATYDTILIHDDAWYARHGVTLHRGVEVVAIDRAARTVTARDGRVTPYDTLILATGSSPFVPPIPGAALPGVRVYRDLDDVLAMREAARRGGKAVVIGGGLLGLEAAAGLAMCGMDTTVVHLMPTLMERQLDPEAGSMLRAAIERRGIAVRCCASTAAILGDTQVTGVRFADGEEIAADLVIMAVGIRPNVALAKAAGLEVKRGIVVDDGLRTSDPHILALGECVEHRGQCYGLVAPLYEMAAVTAARLAGDGTAAYAGSVTATKLKVTGIKLFSAGDFAAAEGRDEIVLRDPDADHYRRLVLQGGQLIGAVLYGDTDDGAFFFDLVQKKADVTSLRDALVFGMSFAEPQVLAAALAPARAPAGKRAQAGVEPELGLRKVA